MLNPNLASKISYERSLNNFQNEAVNRSGVLGVHSGIYCHSHVVLFLALCFKTAAESWQK